MSKGMLYILCATLLFSTQGIIAKIAYSHDVTLTALVFLRLVLTVSLLWLFLRKPQFDKSLLWAIAAGITGYYLAPVLGLKSLHFINANINGFVLASFPAFVMLIKLVVQKKLPSLQQFICFLAIQFGVYLMVVEDNTFTLSQQNGYGVILALLSAMVFAIYILINEHLISVMKSTEFILIAMTSAFVVAGIHTLLLPDITKILLISPTGWGIVALSSLFQLATLYLIAEGLAHTDSTKASLIASTDPLFTAIFAYAILGETLSQYQVFGGAVIMIAIITLETRKKEDV